MPISADQFYLAEPPRNLQQGDIVTGVPLLMPAALEHSVIIRSSHHRRPIEELEAGIVELVHEVALPDAFDLAIEYVAVSAIKGVAMLLTATCDLADPKLDIWTVVPLRPIEGAGLNLANLAANKYANLYGLPENGYFPASFIDLSDLRSVRPQQAPLKNRIASVTREAQAEVLEKFYSAFARAWGYSAGEKVEPLGKYETGKFRCARCNLYDIPVSEKTLPVGSEFPECENCKKINKAAQWYPLTKHRKS